MRFIGLDVHRDFCEVAIVEGGEVRLAGRVQTEPAALALFAQSLSVDDEVALEATGNALEIARIIEPHVARVVLANPKAVKGLTRAGAKTDKIDARMLAKLLAGGFLPAVWLPDEQTRILRRRISARAQLVPVAGSPGKYAYFTQRWEKGSDVNLASMMLADGFEPARFSVYRWVVRCCRGCGLRSGCVGLPSLASSCSRFARSFWRA
jgi:Transposase